MLTIFDATCHGFDYVKAKTLRFKAFIFNANR